ncbi:MAG: acyltransferase family protein [Lachnospiraceae bacterium]|nr:acyltransferase family protein [Lachnospiraceae bacterium]
MQKNRIRYLDIYKGLGIILVVLGHMEATPYSWKLWLNAFHMPLFFVAAGLLTGQGRLYERECGSVIRDRARSILIPYFWFSLISISWDGIKELLTPMPHLFTGIAARVWDFLSFFGISVLWFLPVFFVGATGYQLLRKRLSYPVALALLTLLAVGLCAFKGVPGQAAGMEMSVGAFLLKIACTVLRGCMGMFFCALGEGMGILTECFLERRWALALAGAGMVAVGSWLAVVNARVSGYPVSFCYLLLGNGALFLLAALCLTGGTLFLCCLIGRFTPLEYLGKHSLIIMVTHLDIRVIHIAQQAGARVLAATGHIITHYIVLAVVMVILELFWIWLLNGHLRFLMGKGKKTGIQTVKEEIQK